MPQIIVNIQDILNQRGTMVDIFAHDDTCMGYGSIKLIGEEVRAQYHDGDANQRKDYDNIEHAAEFIAKKVGEAVSGQVYAQLLEKIFRNLPVK